MNEEEPYEKIYQLLDQAESADKLGGAGIPYLEEAVRLADALGNLPLAFEARSELVDHACWSGHPEKMMVAFAWCLAQLDRHPDRFDVYTTLWTYKWVVLSAPAFPEIGLGQLHEMCADIEARYRREGASLRPIHYLRSWVAEATGDDAAARREFVAHEHAPRDHYSDCVACEADQRVDFHAWRGDDEKAVAAAEPILSGRLRCAEVPHRTYAKLLVPLLRLGRVADAADLHRRGYHLLEPNQKLLRRIADHVAFLALTGNVERALRIVEKHLPRALEDADRFERLFFMLDAKLLFERLAHDGHSEVRVRLPAGVALRHPEGRYAPAALAAWCDATAREIAAAFDRRNGNTAITGWIPRIAARATLACDFTL